MENREHWQRQEAEGRKDSNRLFEKVGWGLPVLTLNRRAQTGRRGGC